MNPEFAILKMTGLLAAEIAVVCLLAMGCEVFVRSAVWRRTLWQVCLLSVLMVIALEVSGLGRLIGTFMRQPTPPESRARLVVADPIPEATYTTPVVHSALLVVPNATKPVPTKNQSRQIALTLACIWILGAGTLLCRILLTRAVMVFICARSRLVSDASLPRVVRDLAMRMGMRGTIRLVESPRLRGPIAFGFVRQVIGLPLKFGTEYSHAQQEVILAHELAHLSARDSWWQLLADVALALLWWHPLVWVARRQLRDAAESAADEASLAIPNGPAVLAECLLALGKKMNRAPLIRWSGIGGDGFRSGLGRRVQRLLRLQATTPRPRHKFQIALAKMFCPAVLVLGTVFSSGWMSPAATMKGKEMNTSMWKRSLPAFALLALLGADQPSPAADKAVPATEAVSTNEAKPAAKGRGAANVRRKLERIRLSFQADNLPLGAVINFLIDEARKADPEKEGINVLLYGSEVSPVVVDPATGLPRPGAAPELIDMNSVTIRVMPALLNVRLIDVLDVIMKVADRPLRYSIEDYGVVITTAASKASDLETWTFIVNSPEIFFKGIESAFGIDVPKTGSASGVPSRQIQREVFEQLFQHLGIDWSSPKSVFYNELTGIVMVRAAPEDMMVITAAMATLGATMEPPASAAAAAATAAKARK